MEEHEEPVFDVLGHIARLEASTGAALALLRRCIVADKSPTREAFAAEAGYVFGMPGEAALAADVCSGTQLVSATDGSSRPALASGSPPIATAAESWLRVPVWDQETSGCGRERS